MRVVQMLVMLVLLLCASLVRGVPLRNQILGSGGRRAFGVDLATRADYPALRRLDSRCKRLLWMTGADLRASTSFVYEGSNVYADHLLVALMSARQMAPSVVPVVVLHGIEADYLGNQFVEKLHGLGAIVVFHRPSFEVELRAAVEQATRDNTVSAGARLLGDGLGGTYLRLDIPALLPKVLQHVNTSTVDTDYVLWTDPDVLFLQDMDACTLPRPVIVSVGGGSGHEVAANCGVQFWNLPAYSEIFQDVMDWARSISFGVLATGQQLDQSVLLGFLGHRANVLPDAYNYKPYWGAFPKGPQQAHDPDGMAAIVHVQGPKLDFAVCVIDYLAAERGNRKPLRAVNLQMVKPAFTSCGADANGMGWVARDLVHAYNIDGGDFYRQVAKWFAEYKTKGTATFV